MLNVVGIVILIILILFAYFPKVTVRGYSMYPTYYDGQQLLSRRVTHFEKLQLGAVYVFYDPKDKDKVLIKRLNYVVKAGFSRTEYCYFLGDNSGQSRDSRMFGYVPRSNIIAKIIGG